MKTIRFIFLFALIGAGLISCRKTEEKASQDIVEDVNDAMKPIDDKLKNLTPENIGEPEDKMIQREINKAQDSISNESLN